MSKIFEEVKSRPVSREGYMWLSILFKYNTDGSAEVVRSFAKPAKDSSIKSVVKSKKGLRQTIKIKDPEDSSSLF